MWNRYLPANAEVFAWDGEGMTLDTDQVELEPSMLTEQAPAIWPALKEYILDRGGLAAGDWTRHAIPREVYRRNGQPPDMVAAEMPYECPAARGLWQPEDGAEAMLEALRRTHEEHQQRSNGARPRIQAGRHRYVLLANSAGVHMQDRRGLRTVEILKALWQWGVTHPGSLNVVYFGDYDWNLWLADVDKETAGLLYQGRRVKIAGYTVRYTGLWFEVAYGRDSIVVWDIGRFWQFSFEEALAKSKLELDPADLALIEEWKAKRGGPEWTWENIEIIAEYNRAELRCMVLLVQKMREELTPAGIPEPTAWTGAGALAGSLLKLHNVAAHNEPLPTDVPKGVPCRYSVHQAAHHAYSAGNIQAFRIGHTDRPLTLHDIRSAYPSAMMHLPSLRGGRWRHVTEFSTRWADRFSMWHVRWNWFHRDVPGLPYQPPATERYYPFAWRLKDGSIRYPPVGEGWVHWPEIAVALSLGWRFEVLEGWVFEPATPKLPFESAQRIYTRRQGLRDAGLEGASQLLKLALNAIYGKLCQAKGSTADKPSPFHNLAWAGWITSWTRAQLMEVIHQDPESVVYVMTDSIAAARRLQVEEGGELGRWEVVEYPGGGTVVQAGIGFLHGGDGEIKTKIRGFNRRGFVENAAEWERRIIDAWKRDGLTGVRSSLPAPTSRPVTLGSALQGDRFGNWNQWDLSPREMDLYGGDAGKRTYEMRADRRPWSRLEPLRPTGGRDLDHGLVHPEELMSTAYEPRWAEADFGAMEPAEGRLDAERLFLIDLEAGENA